MDKTSGTTYLNPVYDGLVDASNALAADFSKRYVIRTLLNFSRTNRSENQYAFVDANGVVDSYGGYPLMLTNGGGTVEYLRSEICVDRPRRTPFNPM